MRWERLFDDIEAQLDAAGAAELAGEVAERTRHELALVELADRLAAWCGQHLSVHLLGSRSDDGPGLAGRRLEGRLVTAAQDWLVLAGLDGASTPVLVPLRAVTGFTGLGAAAATSGRSGVGRRLGLASVLRAVARDRSPVQLDLLDGCSCVGTIDSVGADHLDLAEHPADEPRRAAAVRAVRTVPLWAVVAVRPAPGTSGLAG